MSLTPAVREPGGDLIERPSTGPGRELGQKRKPQLRLALGYRDENRNGAPVKTDYFIPRGGDMAVRKFVERYGEKPRAIDIRLPASLGGFIDIRHVAFAGGQGGDGGVLRAIGSKNFALEGTLGGDDKLTVFSTVDSGKKNRKGDAVMELRSEEVYIDDVDDPAAKELGVYLQASVTFGIPDVLGFGGVCEIRSRGKETIDTLWLTAVDIYGQLGAHASMILRPKLVLKESKMRTPLGNTAQVWVVDLYVPESLDEVLGRMREYRELMPAGAASALYGPRAALEASPVLQTPPAEGQQQAAAEVEPDSSGHTSASVAALPDDDEPEDEPGPEAVEVEAVEEPDVDPAWQALADAAGEFKPGSKQWPGMTLREIFEHGDDGRRYFVWCRSNAKRADLIDAVTNFMRVEMPLEHEAAEQAAKAQQELGS